jgi:tRNA-splicing ligase RtcB
MLHSGSRGVGNAIGTYFIELAKKDAANCTSATCRTRTSPTSRKARSTSATTCAAVGWAQKFAARNREVMMTA